MAWVWDGMGIGLECARGFSRPKRTLSNGGGWNFKKHFKKQTNQQERASRSLAMTWHGLAWLCDDMGMSMRWHGYGLAWLCDGMDMAWLCDVLGMAWHGYAMAWV